MKHVNQILKIVMAISVLVVASGCSKKDKGSANIRNRNTRYDGNYNTNPGNFNPGGPGGSYYNSDCPNCGVIYGSNLNSTVQAFIDAPGQLGYIGGSPQSGTGVVFQGNVDSYAQNGFVRIIIWDDIAAQTGEPFVVQLELDPYQSDLSQYNGTLTFRDQYGSVSFRGNFSSGAFYGTVTFQNNNGQSGTLGNFETGECSFVQCR